MLEIREPAVALREAGLDAGHEERIALLEVAVTQLRQEVSALRLKIDDLFGNG